jgi:putative transposase
VIAQILFMPEKYDPNIHHRRSIRIPGYDYSQEGWYFITICAQNRKNMFGEIINGQMRLNSAGLMVKIWWDKVTSKFSTVQTDEHIVMPNHFHGIINIVVGATSYGRSDHDIVDDKLTQTHNQSGQSHRIAPTLGQIVNWFKTMTTNQYIQGVKQNAWPSFHGRLWQRNYYEHIIRNETELKRFRCYIADNPANWQTDEENPNA